MSFIIDKIEENGFTKVILKDSNNVLVEVLPYCGAILHTFGIWRDGAFINVIDHFEDAKDFKANVESNGFKGCKLSPFACRIKNATYKYQDRPYTINKFLLGDNALHGLLYDALFEIVNTEADDTHAAVTLSYSYKGEDKGYPFLYDCIVTYILKSGNALTIITKIINKDKSPIPMQDGWHPYFMLNKKVDELELSFQSKEKLIFDNTMVPTGEKTAYNEFESFKKIGAQKFDDCFTLHIVGGQPVCILKNADMKLQVEIEPDNSYPYLQIYTPDHRNSIALENLSAPPDTFNNGIDLKILQPNEETLFTTSYTITSFS